MAGSNQAAFMEALNSLKEYAKVNANIITKDDINSYFKDLDLDDNKIGILNEIQNRGIKSNIVKIAASLKNPDNTISQRGLDLAEELRKNDHHQIEKDLPKYLTMIVSILTINMLLMFGLSFLFRNWMYSFFHVPYKYFLAVLLLIIPVAIRALLQQILRAQLKSVSYSFTTILNQFVTIGLTVFFAKFFFIHYLLSPRQV